MSEANVTPSRWWRNVRLIVSSFLISIGQTRGNKVDLQERTHE